MSFWLHESRVKKIARLLLTDVPEPIFFVLLLVIVGLMFYFLLFPLWKQNRADRKNIENKVVLIDQARKTKKMHDGMQKRVAVCKKDLKTVLSGSDRSDEQMAAFIQTIDKHYLACHNIQMLPKLSKPYLSVFPVCVQVAGSFSNIFSWIDYLATKKQSVCCQSLVLTKQGNKGISVDAKFYVMSYVDHEK